MENTSTPTPSTSDIKKWVKALRSGKYKQGQDALQSEKGYCCLGVACEIFIPKSKQNLDAEGYLAGYYPHNQPNVPKWLSSIDETIINDTMAATNEISGYERYTRRFISVLNDSLNYTFDEIADCLELVYIHKALS